MANTQQDLLDAFKKQLVQPDTYKQLTVIKDLAEADPRAAAAQLHATLYEAAAAVFPQASTQRRHQQQGSQGGRRRMRQFPWFDRECALARGLARQRIRAAMCADPNSHISQQAVKVVGSKYNRLLDRKRAVWRQERGQALLQLHQTDAKAFFSKWKTKGSPVPITASRLLQHFIHLQQKRKFKPSQPPSAEQQAVATAMAKATAAAAAETAAAAAATVSPPSNVSSSAPLSSPSPAPNQEGISLNADFTTVDVLEACKKLSSNSGCLGPLKAVLIKAAKGVLAPVLAKLFTAVFRSGSVPRDWLLGAITAIHKKGDVMDPNNYRGITVGHVLGKLYALMLNLRLSAWAEANKIRAVGQAGFRRGHRTTDNCFVLRALVERARSRGVKLYICAVDLEKAFDSVDRSLLWESLQRAGIGGSMLATLQALYADVPVCVKTDEGLSSTFQSVIGVKQGCPLSPLLFGIFLDDFELHLQRTVPPALAQLPQLSGKDVPPMLFADDMLLISTSVDGLNAQLLSLQAYCDAKKLTVNAAKTQVMIMRPGGGSGGKLAAREAFFYAGQQLEVVKTIKYLGLTFAQLSKSQGFACCAEELAKAGRRALLAMRRRAWELGTASVQHQSQLFDIFVKPVLSYGCEVWGVDVLDQPDSAPERVHRWFCRRLLGLPRGASSAVALAELGRWPLHVHWVQQMARFWNRLLGLQGSQRLVGLAFRDNLELMREQLQLKAQTGREVGSPCWCLRWLRSLQSVACTRTGTLLAVTKLEEESLVERTKRAFLAKARAPSSASQQAAATAEAEPQPASGVGTRPGGPAVSLNTSPGPAGCGAGCSLGPGLRGGSSLSTGLGLPAATARSGSGSPPISAPGKFALYESSVRGKMPWGEMAPHLIEGAVGNARHRACLSRFRSSCHALRVETDRHLPVAVKPPRHLRTCRMCDSSELVEDEHHFVFACPLYSSLRFDFADLFSTDCPTLALFLNQLNQDRVAQFVHACFDLRRQMTQMSLAGSVNAL